MTEQYPPYEPPPPTYPSGGPAHAGWQPAPTGYGYGPGYPTPSLPTRSVTGLGIATQILLIVQTLAALGLLIPLFHERNIIDRVRNGDGVTLSEAQHADNTLNAVNGIVLVLYLATGIVWIIWFYRARKNVDAWGARQVRFGPGWAIGGWICPIVNFWFPYLIAKDVLADSERPADDAGWQRRGSPLLIAWWIGYVALLVIGFVDRAQDPNTLDELTTYTNLIIAAIAIRVVTAVLAILVVRRITAAQTARMATPPAAPWGTAPPSATPWAG